MTAPANAPAITFLRRVGLLTAVLALIAGIFGMHVMTGTHAMHSPVTAAASVSAHHGASPAGHAAEHLSGPFSAPDVHAAQDEAGARTVPCTDSGNCTSMQSMTAACTPSAKTGSLAAPLPGTGIIARNTNAAMPSAIGVRWSYLPGSPSPGELCISRT
jgi:hypothetical protein